MLRFTRRFVPDEKYPCIHPMGSVVEVRVGWLLVAAVVVGVSMVGRAAYERPPSPEARPGITGGGTVLGIDCPSPRMDTGPVDQTRPVTVMVTVT